MANLDIPAVLAVRAAIARDRDHMDVAANGEDHLVDKHGRELFGVSVDPDLTPIEHRYVAPKHVFVEWVGQTSPYQSDTVIALKARGMLEPIHLNILEQAALQCTARVDGFTTRSIGVRDGLSQTYCWGKLRGTYIVEMPAHDADRLMSIAGHEFRIREKGATESKQSGDDAWRQLFASLRIICGRRGLPAPPSDEEIRIVRIRVGDEEKLVGIRVNDGAGAWRAA